VTEPFVDLTGKTVLVTGGSRGIGAGIVRCLLDQGASVVFSYLSSREESDALVAEYGEDRALAVQADQADAAEVLRLWETAVAFKGGIDVVVSNAAVRPFVQVDDPFEEWDRAWRWALDANLIATAHLCRLAILHFRERGGGTIIGISGRIGVRGDAPDTLPDGASKGGIISLIRGIARGFAKENVSAFLVSPGVITSPAAEEHLQHYGAEKWLAEIPIGELGKPEDVGNVVVFLASGRARYATGASVPVHGGSFLY
jgi:3-oxoacyl-[acyl-carrier protein] reductase